MGFRVCETRIFVRERGGRLQDDDSVGELTEGKPLCGSRGAQQVPPLRYPGFPVELGGVGELHAAFFTESRTRGYVQRCVAGNPGSLWFHGKPGQAG